MAWLIIFAVITGFILYLLLSPVVCTADTRVPLLSMHWAFASVAASYRQGQWWLRVKVFFFEKNILLRRNKKAGSRVPAKKKPKKRKGIPWRMIKKILRTIRIVYWHVSVDTGDNVLNEWLYPLNFLPALNTHVHINFNNENYCLLKAKVVPAKALLALLK